MRGTLRRDTPYRLRLEGLENRVNPLVNWGSVASGIAGGLTALGQTVHGYAAQSQAALPVLGKSVGSLANQADQAFADAAGSLSTIFQNLQQRQNQGQTITEAAVKSAVKASPFVRDVTNDQKVTEADVAVTVDPATGNVSVTVRLGESVNVPIARAVNFDLGLPGVPFKITGGSALTAGLDVDYTRLTFGMRNNGTEFYTESPDGQGALKLTVSAAATNANMVGTIGFLQVKATPLPGQKPAEVQAVLNFNANGLALSAPTMTGNAAIHLKLDAGFVAGRNGGPGLPHIVSDFVMNWGLGGNPNAPQTSLGGAPTVEFNNVKLGLGSYLGEQLQPIIEAVQDVTVPLTPVYQALAAPIPGLSDLGERIPGVGTITLEKLAELAVAARVLPPDYQLLGELAVNLHKLVTVIKDTELDPKTNDPLVPMGNFSLGGNGDLRSRTLPNGQTFPQLLDAIRNGGTIPIGGLSDLVPLAQEGLKSVQAKINEFLPQLPGFVQDKVRETFTMLDKQLARLQNGYGLKFPLIDDPRNGVFRLLLGQDVDLARFDARAYIPDIKETRELDVWGPIKAKFTGKLDLNLELHAGTDTYGLRQFFTSIARGRPDPTLIDDGFYFDAAKPLAQITNGSITAEAGVELQFGEGLELVAYPHLTGSLASDDFRVGFVDPNRDGDHKLRVFRANELGNQIFDVRGTVAGEFKFAVDAGARVRIPLTDIIIVDGVKEVWSETFARGELLSFGDIRTVNPFNRPDVPPAKVDVIFDTNFEDGANDGNKDVIVAQVVGGNLQLWFNGVLRPANMYPISTVKSLTILGSDDDSDVTISGTVRKPIALDGGGGTDRLLFADGSYTGAQIPTYGIAASTIGRGTRSNLVGNPLLYDTSIRYGKVEDIYVQTSYGKANVYVFSLSVPTAVSGGELVNNYYVGSPGTSLLDLGSLLTLWGGSSQDNLYVDDRAQDRHVSYAVDYEGLTRTSEVRIYSDYLGAGYARYVDYAQRFNYYGMDYVALAGASGGNTFTVKTHGIDSPEGPAKPLTVVLYSGTGDDDVHVAESSGPVTVHGQNGSDTVTVGGTPQGTQWIGLDVIIDNKSGLTSLIVDDRGDTLSRTVTLATNTLAGTGTGSVFGLTPHYPASSKLSAIQFKAADMDDVTILGGAGGNTFTVQDTVRNVGITGFNNRTVTRISAGPGNDTVQVLGTTGPMFVDAEAGTNRVQVGGFAGKPGMLLGLDGTVFLIGGEQPGTAVEVNDARTAVGRYLYTLDANRVVRSTFAGQNKVGSVDYSGLRPGAFDLVGSNTGNRYTLDGTPRAAAGAAVRVHTGTGSDAATVLGTSTGQVELDLGDGVNQSVVVGDATHSLERLAGRVAVTAVNPVTAKVTNEASTIPHQIVIDQATGGGLWLRHLQTGEGVPPNEKEIRFTTVSTLDLQNGTGSRSTTVYGTPAGTTLNVRGAAGWGDIMWLDTSYNRILGPVNYFGEDLQDLAYFYDYVNTVPHAYTFRTDPAKATSQRIERDGQAPFTYSGGYQIVFYASVVGNNDINIQSVPAGIFLNLVFAPGDDVTVGSAAPDLGGSLAGVRGPLAFSGYGPVDVVLDDSGNLATGPKRVTMTPRSGVYSYGNLIEGLTGSSIQWRLDDQSTMDIRGGAADDTYALATSSLPAAIRIDGGGGVNALDYSALKGLPGQANWFTGESDSERRWAAEDISGHIGFLRNGVTTPAGKVGNAFGLDGADDFVEVPDYASQTPASITLEGWVNPDTVSGPRVIVSKADAIAPAPDTASWALLNIDGRLRFGVYQGAVGRVIETDAPVLTTGAWQHVAATFDATSQAMTLLVNGVPVPSSFVPGQTATITAMNDSSVPMRIGAYAGSSGFWDGMIDELSLFNRALAPDEIRDIVAADSAGKAGVAGGMTVNLQTNTATGLRGGIANIRNVIGGAGYDILVGNGGNVLTGGAGRDVLIAGAGPGAIVGGTGEDLLIGGRTAHDADPIALAAVRAVWSRTDLDYATRKTNLLSGLLAGTAVQSNGQADTLTGGEDRDLFFGVAGELVGPEAGEDLVAI